MEIFENWLAENSTTKNAKPVNADKADTVPGLGFKDKEAAENTIRYFPIWLLNSFYFRITQVFSSSRVLDGRDPDYQKLAVKGLLGSAKRVLSGTKSEEKIADIKAAMEVLETFVKDFDNENRGKKNMPYLSLDVIEKYPAPTDPLICEFLEIYRAKDGNYKHLRTLFPKDDDSTSWDIVRNKNLSKVREEYDEDPAARLFDSEGAPSEAHLKMVYWAFSPSADKVKAHAQKLGGGGKKGKSEKKRKASTSSSEGDDDEDEDMDRSSSKKTKKH
jgi:hypothetical protein